jgi:lysophospholipase L1-like esterase
VVVHVNRQLPFACAAVAVAFVWGFASGHREVFPFHQLVAVKQLVFPEPHAEVPLARPLPRMTAQEAARTIFAATTTRANIVMLGDSITAIGPWTELFPGVLIANRGVGGDTTHDIVRRIADTISLKPRRVFIMAGVNDAIQGENQEAALANFVEIAAELSRHSIPLTVVATIECERAYCGRALDRVRKLNLALSKWTRENGIPYVDLNDELSGADGLRPNYTWDGIHLTGAAYLVWRSRIEKALRQSTGGVRVEGGH